MMNDSTAQVSVRILDKEYQVACPASERTDLLDSAEALNAKMLENVLYCSTQVPLLMDEY